MSQTRFLCPHCAFRIFNRRVAKCESCGCLLPADLLFQPSQIKKLDAEYELSKKNREARARQHKSGTGDGGSVGGEGFWGSDDSSGGDGGGGD